MVALSRETVVVQTTPEAPASPPPARETRQERKAREKAEREARERAEHEAKTARYRQLRANVRRRRAAYVVIILLAIGVLAATVWDIVFNDSDLKWFLLPAYLVLFVWGVLLLISRKRHLQEVNEIKTMERAWLQCETCSSVFQFGSESFLSRRRVGFTCPVCGDESALPLPGTDPVEQPLPQGRLEEANYLCGHCKEDIVVGVYGGRPRDVDFRACPKCGVSGQVRANPTPA